MALEHAVLVSLAEQSASGYELAHRFDKSIGYFWSATHQQIYRVLGRMNDAGWILGETFTQVARPDKTVYTVSDTGRAELSRWISDTTEPSRLRDELAVKIRGAAYGDMDAVRAEVARHREIHATRLDVYRLAEKRDFSTPTALSGSELHQYLVLRGGIRVEEGFVAWCDDVLTAFERGNS